MAFVTRRRRCGQMRGRLSACGHAQADDCSRSAHEYCGLIGILPAGLIRGFPFPRRHGIGVCPEALARCPGQFFEHLEAGIAGARSLPPGQAFFQQLAPHIAPIMQQHLGRHPTLLISREPSHDHITVPQIGCDRVLRLFPVGLLEFGTIDIFEIDRLTLAVVTNGQSITLMDGDDSCGKVSP
jgi:hypothetical protein